MPNKPIHLLPGAVSVEANDLFPMEQGGVAKKVTAQTLEDWLVELAGGIGTIESMAKISAEGLVDTYRFTFTTGEFRDLTVTNGRAIQSITEAGQSEDGRYTLHRVTYNDGTTEILRTKNGDRGAAGQKSTIYIKWAAQKPSELAPTIGNIPDAWMGIYTGYLESAPTQWERYTWVKVEGGKGDTGDPAQLVSSKTEYQLSDSGTVVPDQVWTETVPTITSNKWLWTRTTITFNSGQPVVSYSVTFVPVKRLEMEFAVIQVTADQWTAYSSGYRAEAYVSNITENSNLVINPFFGTGSAVKIAVEGHLRISVNRKSKIVTFFSQTKPESVVGFECIIFKEVSE